MGGRTGRTGTTVAAVQPPPGDRRRNARKRRCGQAMTSWNRRLSAAAARPGVSEARTPRNEILAEAIAVGVVEEDLTALMAMANIARDRPGFTTTLDVRVRHGDGTVPMEFEILHEPDGARVRPTPEYRAVLGSTEPDDEAPAVPEPDGFDDDRDDEPAREADPALVVPDDVAGDTTDVV